MQGSTNQTSNTTGMPIVLSETIRQLCNDGLTTVVELATIAGISDSAVSRYKHDEAQAAFASVRLWVKHHPDIRVRTAFARCLLHGTDLAVEVGEDVQDMSNATAAVREMHQAVETLGSQLVAIGDALEDGKLGDGEISQIDEQGRQVLRHVKRGLAALNAIHVRQQESRRPALRMSKTA